LRADPFGLFAHYASATLTGDQGLELTPRGKRQVLADLMRRPMTHFALHLMSPLAEMERMLGLLEAGPRPARALLEELPGDGGERILRSLGWLLKMGLIRLPGRELEDAGGSSIDSTSRE
jgi:hypothetical protein